MKDLISQSIQDADGQEHAYTMVPHGPYDGQKVANELFTLLAPAAKEIKADWGKMITALKTKGSDPLDSDIDIASLLSTGLTAAGGLSPQLTQELIRHVSRDGEALSNRGAFEKAYQANYGELAEVIVWVIKENRWLDFLVRLGMAAIPRL